MNLCDCITHQNICRDFFAGALPGVIIFGKVQRSLNQCFEFHDYVLLPRFSLEPLALAVEQIAQSYAKQKKNREKNEEEEEREYNIDSGKIILKKQTLSFERTGLCPYIVNLSEPASLQRFCAGLYAVAFSILLPRNDQFEVFCTLNIFLREKTKGLNISPKRKSEILQNWPVPIRHYLKMNFDIVRFAYRMSVLGNIQ